MAAGVLPGEARRWIVGNWKAPAQTAAASGALAAALSPGPGGVHVAVCPPFTALTTVRGALAAGIDLGAQDVFWEDAGAYTGEITAPMLKAAGCSCAIVGHSERRRLLGETDEMVGRKLRACWRHALVPILCVGETLQQHEAGQTAGVLGEQVRAAIGDADPAPLLLAYEPVWAIGTGEAASPGDCALGLAVVRSTLALHWGAAADACPALYGGSVTAENCRAFWDQGEADGALVGGASLDAAAFAAICRAAARQGGARS